MRALLDEDFWPAFIPMAVVHLIMLLSRVNLLQLKCTPNCNGILFADMPISLFYLFIGDAGTILLSFILGTVLWGIWGVIAYKLLKTFFQSA